MSQELIEALSSVMNARLKVVGAASEKFYAELSAAYQKTGYNTIIEDVLTAYEERTGRNAALR